MKRLTLIACLFFCALRVPAQTDSLRYYLQDDRLSSRKTIIKTDIIAVLHGELPFFVERVLSKNTSLEAGVGLLLPYYNHDLLPLLVKGQPDFTNNKSGSSFWLAGRRYFKRAPDQSYMEIRGHQRRFSTLTLTDASFSMGKQWIAGKRLIIDGSLGVGVRFQKSRHEDVYLFDNDYPFMIIAPLRLKFGYLL